MKDLTLEDVIPRERNSSGTIEFRETLIATQVAARRRFYNKSLIMKVIVRAPDYNCAEIIYTIQAEGNWSTATTLKEAIEKYNKA